MACGRLQILLLNVRKVVKPLCAQIQLIPYLLVTMLLSLKFEAFKSSK
jgi:hypothetical protein